MREKREPVKAGRFVHVGGRHQRGHALVRLPFGENGPEVPPGDRIDTGRRLVQNGQLRLMDQRTDQAELLLHSARELFHQPAAEAIQAGDRQQPGLARAKLRLRDQPQPGKEVDVFFNGELGVEVQPQSLREKSDPRFHPFRRPLGIHEGPEHFGGSPVVSQHPGDRFHHTALARTIRSDEAIDFTPLHGEVQAVDRKMLLVTLDEAGHTDNHLR